MVKQVKKLDPLRPRFPRAAILEVTQMSGSLSMAQLNKNCTSGGIDLVLVHAAATVAQEHFNKVRRSDMASTYPQEVAATVAVLKLDEATPTKAESVVAALFEQTLAVNPNSWGTMRDDLLSNLSRSDQLTLERKQAVDEAVRLADQIARFSRVPRLYASNKDLPDQIFQDAAEMALAMPNPRVAVIKTVEAMSRLRTWERVNDRDPKEAQNILTIAEKLYQPLAGGIGWKAAEATIEDYVFKYRQPEERKRVIQAVEEKMGEGFFGNEKEIVGASTKFIQRVVETTLNRDKTSVPVEVSVHGRIKQPASVAKKIGIKGLDVDEMTDLLAFRVVLPGNNPELCYQAANALLQVFKPKVDDYKDYIADPSKPYESLHLVGAVKHRANPNLGILIPGELQGKVVEIQIRDEVMDRAAEVGIANHLSYKAMGPIVAGNRFFGAAVAWAQKQNESIRPAQPIEVFGKLSNDIVATDSHKGQTVTPEFMIALPQSSAAERTALYQSLQTLFKPDTLQVRSAEGVCQANTISAKINEPKQLPEELSVPEELRRSEIKVHIVQQPPKPAIQVRSGWNNQTETPVSPYLDRVAEVRSKLTALNAGKEVRDTAPAKDIFVVRPDGSPQRLPNGASVMDAAVALDQDNIYARKASLNGVQVNLDAAMAKSVRISNGDTLMVDASTRDMTRPPDSAWLKRGNMLYEPARFIVLTAVHEAQSKLPATGRGTRKSSKPAPTTPKQG